MAGTEPIRDKKQVKKLADYYLKRKELRNYVLIVLGLSTALRISDLLRLRWRDVYDFERERFYDLVELVEQKTGKSKGVAMNADALKALRHYKGEVEQSDCPEVFLFSSPILADKPLNRVQAYRIVREAAEAVGIKERVSPHSLRKTFGYHAWKKHVPVAVIMDIYNHTSLSVTRRYLGVCQDDRNHVYKSMCFLE